MFCSQIHQLAGCFCQVTQESVFPGWGDWGLAILGWSQEGKLSSSPCAFSSSNKLAQACSLYNGRVTGDLAKMDKASWVLGSGVAHGHFHYTLSVRMSRKADQIQGWEERVHSSLGVANIAKGMDKGGTEKLGSFMQSIYHSVQIYFILWLVLQLQISTECCYQQICSVLLSAAWTHIHRYIRVCTAVSNTHTHTYEHIY